MTETTVFRARSILTMQRAVPRAGAVAVREGRVLGVGSYDEVTGWGAHTVDDRFADHVLVPGFVEAHAHVMAGGFWEFPYVGWFDRRDPSGRVWAGCDSIDAVVARLAEVAASTPPGDDDLLIAWGLDPIYFPGERLVAAHLDAAVPDRPVFVFHASGHLATLNSAMMRRCGVDEAAATPGVAIGADGRPNGEIQEGALRLAAPAMLRIRDAIHTDEAKWRWGAEARNAGHTLVTDLGTSNLADDAHVDSWRRVTDDPAFPTRVMVATSNAFGGPTDHAELARIALARRAESSDRLHFGIVKLILDGSIQGYTARISWPHYYRPPEGHPGNGLWLIPPEQMADIVSAHHEAGLTVHCHCNGDEATEVFLDAVEEALRRHPRVDHRHTVQHCQLTTPAQYRRMAALGVSANIFANHLLHWGDQHRDLTVGPERAAGMDACGTALAEGVRFAIHSDAPVTPLGHLHTMWCAVNRLTASGDVLGPDERVPAEVALRAATIDAAHQLRLDHEIGSIEAGKRADFAVLDDDPLTVAPEAMRDIGVWGTVLGGVPQEADTAP